MGTLSNVPSDRSLRCIPRKHVGSQIIAQLRNPDTSGRYRGCVTAPAKTRKPVEVSISVDRFGGAGRAHEPSASSR